MAGRTRGTVSVRTLWGIAKSPELRLTDEELHLVVAAHTGKDSIRALSQRELWKVIRTLGAMKESAGKAPGSGGRKRGNPSTENQRKKIYMLARSLGWDNPARLNGFCGKMFQVGSVEWLDGGQCSKLIEALKKMAEREAGKEETDGWEAENDRPGEKNPGTDQKAAAGRGDSSAGQAQAEPEAVH